MTDLERDLTDLLHRKVRDLRTLPSPPPARVLRRVRRRQGAAAFIAVGGAAVLVAGAVAGVQALVNGPPRVVAIPPATAQLDTGGVTLRYPKGWQAVSLLSHRARYVGRRDATAVLPILQATNFSPARGGGPVCPDRPGSLGSFPTWGVFLYVEQVVASPAGTLQPASWPVTAAPGRPRPFPTNVCEGGAERVRWQAAGRVFEARLLAGPDASAADEAKLIAAFEGMRFGPLRLSEGYYGPLVVPLGPEVTVESGRVDAEPWTLVAQNTESGTCVSVDFPAGTRHLLDVECFAARGSELAAYGMAVALDPFGRAGRRDVAFLYGVVVPQATRVEFRPSGRAPIEAAVRSIPWDHSLGVAGVSLVESGRAIDVTIIVRDDRGRELGRQTVTIGPSGT